MYIPHTEIELNTMLADTGKKSMEELFNDVPEKFRFPSLKLPPALSEMGALAQLKELSSKNISCDEKVCLLGAGVYDHYIPAAVDELLHRGEFFTAYTPYQPEISQGTLQAIFEYQSLIASLTGMDVCNASHYDGATAAAEACLSAFHNFRGLRKSFVLSPFIHPHYRATIRTYLSGFEGIEIIGDEFNQDSPNSPDKLKEFINENTAIILMQYPDFMGRIFYLNSIISYAHEKGCLAGVVINPMALGIFKSPSEFGADFIVGEGQPLGIPLSFGGPFLGIFTTRKDLVRKVSGRLVGETVDAQGRRGYVLTLTAREQHIRREKATSNICTNQGLMALASAIYLSLLGPQGLRKVGELCFSKSHYAAQQINYIENYSVDTSIDFFNEFVIRCPKPISKINEFLLRNGFIGGYDLGIEYPQLSNHMLVAVTEKVSKSSIDQFCQLLKEVAHA